MHLSENLNTGYSWWLHLASFPSQIYKDLFCSLRLYCIKSKNLCVFGSFCEISLLLTEQGLRQSGRKLQKSSNSLKSLIKNIKQASLILILGQVHNRFKMLGIHLCSRWMIFLAAMLFKETGGVYSTPFYTDYSHDEHSGWVWACGTRSFLVSFWNETKYTRMEFLASIQIVQKKSSRISPVHLCGVLKWTSDLEWLINAAFPGT